MRTGRAGSVLISACLALAPVLAPAAETPQAAAALQSETPVSAIAGSAAALNIDAELISRLTREISQLRQRIDELEARQTRQETAAAEPTKPASGTAAWTESIKVSGDFRYRHDAIDVEDARERHRQRLRARIAMVAKPTDGLEIGLGLASGSDNPLSSNQTLGDAGSTKDINLDLAYATWSTPVEGLKITGGKFKNPLHRPGKHGLIWDSDLRPEGLALQYRRGALFANMLGSWMEESSSDDDSYLLGGQLGINSDLGAGRLTAGVGYYNFFDTRGEPVFFDGDPQGNRVDAAGNYVSGFELVEGFVEYNVPLAQHTFSVFADYVHNLEADNLETGYALGVNLQNESWSLGYAYQDLEADAVLGTLTDSNFFGGGTDGKGHVVRSSYALSDRVKLAGTLFVNERNMDIGMEQDYNRLMLDLSFKY